MKRILISLIVASGLLASAGTLSAQTQSPDRPSLQVEVSLPASSDILHERDVAEALTARVRDVFQRRGYEGKVHEMLRGDSTETGEPVLAINLIRWRMDRAGFVECSFTAGVRQADGTVVPLGVFTASEVAMGTGRWGLSDTFERAAEHAADQLWTKLRKTEILPQVTATAAS